MDDASLLRGSRNRGDRVSETHSSVARETAVEQIRMDIRVDDLSSPEVIQLLHEHLHSMTLHSPPESIHALDVEALRKPDITFWSAWQGSVLMGCCAIKELDFRHGEIKSM